VGLVLGLCCLAPAWSPRPLQSFAKMAVFLLIFGAITYSVFDQYTEVDRFQAQSEEQSTAAYRRELLDKYQVIAERGGLWGWGRTNRPVVTGMESVDNWYLLVRLQYGLAGLYLFLSIQVLVVFRIYRSALTRYLAFPEERQFRFALGAVLVSISVALGTVYLGLQVFSFFFLLVGWAEACVLQRTPVQALEGEPVKISHRPFAFERVLA
jgi:hypothetical protein